LRESTSVGAEDHRQMTKGGNGGTQSLIEQDLLRRIGDVIIAAKHVRHSHEDVIRDDGEVVDRRLVGPEDDEIFDLLVTKTSLAMDEVIPDGFAFRDAETNRGRIPRVAAGAYLSGRESGAASVVAEAEAG